MANQNLKIQLTAIDKTRQAFSSVRAGLGRVGSSIGNVRTALAALGAGVALKQFATQIDDLAKASGRLGLTVNELQSLQFAASQTGASAEELEKGLTRFSRAISEASSGIGTGLRSFEALGIKVTDAQNNLRPTSELLDEVSDRLAQIEAPADRVRIAFDLFGRSGVNLVNTLQNGSGAVKELQDEFNAVTLLLTDEQAKAVEAANDRFDKLGRILGSIGQRISSVVVPALARISEFIILNVLKALNGATKAVRSFLNEIVDFANSVGITMEKFTFGEGLNQELDRIIINLEKSKTVTDEVADSGRYYLDISDKLSQSVGFQSQQFKKLRDSMVAVPVTYDEIGNKVTNLGERSKTAFEKYIDAANDMKSATEKIAINGINRLEDALTGLMSGTMSAKDAFKSMASSIIADIARMQAKRMIAGFMGGMDGGAGGSGGGFGNILGSLFGGFRANGGAVSAGKAYVVGERGAEMFVPNSSGQIIPNGGGGVTVNQTINLSTGVQQTVRAEVMNMLPSIQESTKAAVIEARRRGGSFAAAFGG